jgi:hypothetical protein
MHDSAGIEKAGSEVKAVTTSGHAPQFELSVLGDGMPGLPRELGRKFAEAAATLLENRGHSSGVRLAIDGDRDFQSTYNLIWSRPGPEIPESVRYPIEWGAYGVAIVVVKERTGKVVVDMAANGTGFEFWLDDQHNEDGFCFEDMALLNVSGILNGDETVITSRVATVLAQLAGSGLPRVTTYVAIVEFGVPMTRVVAG